MILFFDVSYNFALDLPKVIALLAIPHIRDIRNNPIARNSITSRIVGSISAQNFELVKSFTSTVVVISEFCNPKSDNESRSGRIAVWIFCFSTPSSIIVQPDRVAIALFPSISISEYAELL
jgi:hypothetical protein